VKKPFRDLLHQYKVDAFKITHNKQVDEDLTREVQAFVTETLNEDFHYQFHADPNPERLETLQLIKNFTVEAVMPPIIERVMRRVVALEKQHALMVQLVDGLLEAMSEEGAGTTD
jgi:hypothetical protein